MHSGIDNFEKEAKSHSIVSYEDKELGSIVEKLARDDAMMAWIDDANNRDAPFPIDSNNDSSNWNFDSGDDKSDSSSD